MTEKSSNPQETKAHFTCKRATRFAGAKQAVLVFSTTKDGDEPMITAFDEDNVYLKYAGRQFCVTFSSNPIEPHEIVAFSDKSQD